MIITGVEEDLEIAEFKAKCLSSFRFFTESFFELRTGRKFNISKPVNRQPHQLTVAEAFTKVFNLEVLRLWMSMPPGHGKSTFCTYFIPWCLAKYPDCNFAYVSYNVELATEHTANIKGIMQMPEYRKLFGVELSGDSSAKDNFKTIQGGAVAAFGSEGGITGRNAGLQNENRFSGCVLMDDMHKPSEVFSDTTRQRVIDTYMNTIENRPRGPNVAIIGIGHALHEEDLRSFLLKGGDGMKWEDLKLPAEDENGFILAPDLLTPEMIKAKKEHNEYVWYSQYQQDPQPPGGGIFKPDSFELLDSFPEMLCTFITVDTAESVKDYADYSVFSFWGVYEIEHNGRKTGEFGLHWIDCYQERIEPANLEIELRFFYEKCLNFEKKPSFIAIEKKSTGTTLISTLDKIRGFEVRAIERTKASGNKGSRYLEMSPYISKRLVSLPKYGKHVTTVIEHMKKITLNNTHAHDDIADTCYDAVKIAFIDKSLKASVINKDQDIIKKINMHSDRLGRIKTSAYSRSSYF